LGGVVGVLGLCLGMSFLSLVEIVELAFEVGIAWFQLNKVVNLKTAEKK
jgi:hypothetical protein